MDVIQFTKYTSIDYLTKVIGYNNEIVKTSLASMSAGKYETVEVKSLNEFVSVLDMLEYKQAVGYGVAEEPNGKITTKKNEGFEGAISRTKGNFKFSDRPGIFMVDIDPRGTADRLTAQQAHSQLVQAMPELAQVEMVCRGSASSSIYVSKDFMDLKQDHELIPEGGWHFYFVVDKASEIPRIGEILGKRLWLNGKGYILPTSHGSQLVRCLADTCVWQGERLDFASGAKCIEPLERRPKPPVYFGSEEMLISKAVKTLKAGEEIHCKELIEKEKADTKGEAKGNRERWLEARIPPGITQAEKDACKQVLEQSIKGGVLSFDFELTVKKGQNILARDLLLDPDKWNGQIICDPLEPEYRGWGENTTVRISDGKAELCSWSHGERTVFTLSRMERGKGNTSITIFDEPCGSGKSSGLIEELKDATDRFPNAKFLVVLVTLDEIEKRYLPELGEKWYQPDYTNADSKRESIVKLMEEGKNILATHKLYEDIRCFEHLLSEYHVMIDEVPTTVEQVTVKFGQAIFDNLIKKQRYIEIDPVTQKITAASNWHAVADQYKQGVDLSIKQFMNKVIWSEVFYVRGVYCILPLPDSFFLKPKSLTILTFLFKGTQLNRYMEMKGYKCTVHQDVKALNKFKRSCSSKIQIFEKHITGRTGYTVMSDSGPQRRRQVGHFAKKFLKNQRKEGEVFDMDKILVASHKDAWFGKEENPGSKVSNATRLKSITGLSAAAYTPLVTRGTNQFRDRNILFLLGKLNMHPNVAAYLGMETKEAREQFEISELIQLIYRTAIRDGKDIYLVTPDKSNAKLLETFLKG